MNSNERTKTTRDTAEREIVITRTVDAPRELVFEAFSEVTPVPWTSFGGRIHAAAFC